jgi:hypothetical protein
MTNYLTLANELSRKLKDKHVSSQNICERHTDAT